MINEVLEVMITLAKEGMTMVVVTHEMGFAREVADKVVFMDAGAIVEVLDAAGVFHQPAEPAQPALSQTDPGPGHPMSTPEHLLADPQP